MSETLELLKHIQKECAFDSNARFNYQAIMQRAIQEIERLERELLDSAAGKQ